MPDDFDILDENVSGATGVPVPASGDDDREAERKSRDGTAQRPRCGGWRALP
jgi:hypothetical protein